MSRGNLPVADAVLNLQRQFEKTEKIADGRAVFSDFLRYLILCQTAFRRQAFQRKRNLDSIEILPLNVFDKGKLKLA